VEITQIEDSVYQSDYLDFTILMKNMGDAPTENFVEYWISGMDNATWSYSSFSVEIAGGANASRIRNLYIPSHQSTGQYILNVKVTYDNVSGLYASASASFYVVSGAAPGPGPGPGPSPGPAAPGGPTVAPGAPKIEITKYSPEIGAETGSVKYPVVEVKNTGGVTLYNVTLKITGIPTPWIEKITPEVIEKLTVDNTSTFTIGLRIPAVAEAKEYAGKIIADANVTRDEKTLSITIFTSRAELIRWEVEGLKKALQEFEVDVENAEKSGKDVSEVLPLIDQINEQIRLAEDYLLKKMYDESLSAVHTGWSLLERARYILSQAPFVETLIETIFPPWLIVVLIIMISVIVILVLFVKRMKGVFDRVFKIHAPSAPGAVKRSVFIEKMKEKGTLARERANMQRVLDLMEREYKEGLISEKAYNDLKKRNEEKLKKMGERISAMK
ncbi:MAG: NEW3 domain-containing protein, partial [Candidatus Aenigmarchaeota archaeon]